MSLPANRCALLASLPKRSVGAEIGVYRGAFALRMLTIVHPRRLYLVDDWGYVRESIHEWYSDDHLAALQRVMMKMRAAMRDGRVRVLCGMSAEMADLIPDDELDWVYIDADHSYEGCLADLRAYYPKVKLGGVIAGHDFVDKDEHRWIGVPRAVREFVHSRVAGPLFLTAEKEPSFWFRRPA